jgi:hypothetical protein
MIKLFGQA